MTNEKQGLNSTHERIQQLEKNLSDGSAKAELQQIYDSSKYLSARYAAGKALNLEVDNQLRSWARGLDLRLYAQKQEGTRQELVQSMSDYRFGGPDANYLVDVPNMVPDREARIRAACDSVKLFELTKSEFLKEMMQIAYDDVGNKWGRDDVVAITGRALGYSSVGIGLHKLLLAAKS